MFISSRRIRRIVEIANKYQVQFKNRPTMEADARTILYLSDSKRQAKHFIDSPQKEDISFSSI